MSNNSSNKVDKMKATNDLISKDSKVEFDEPQELIRYNNKSISKIPYFPVDDKIIVKLTFEESIAIIRDKDKVLNSNPISIEVVGIGSKVTNVQIGDKVDVTRSHGSTIIELEGNYKSIKKMNELARDIKVNGFEANTRKIIMIEYFLIPAFSINAIIK